MAGIRIYNLRGFGVIFTKKTWQILRGMWPTFWLRIDNTY